MKWFFLAPIAFYRRVISRFLPASCRFFPTCSAYAQEAIEVHGAFRGFMLSVRRICRCHPWNPGGVDSVPPRKHKTSSLSEERYDQ